MKNLGMDSSADVLRRILHEKIIGSTKEKQIMLDQKTIPKPLLPANLSSMRLTITDIDPIETARQLALSEQALYRAIRPQELLNQAWNNKKLQGKVAPNILAMIGRFNAISVWVCSEIVQKELIADRVKLIETFILIAQESRLLHNFNAAQEILSGLSNTPVHRMRKTWALVDSKILATYDNLNQLLTANLNYINLRNALHGENPPSIPYLGMYLRDLTFIEEGNQDFIMGNLINFTKRNRVATVIREVQQYQHTPYALQEVPEIKNYLLGVNGVDDKVAYEYSLLAEPRESNPPNPSRPFKPNASVIKS